MRLPQFVLRNAMRSPFRTTLTVLTVGIMLAAFVFPRTLVVEQEEFVRQAAKDRVLIMPRSVWSGALPARYAEEVRATQGVVRAMGVTWAGLKLPGKDDVFFASNAVEPVPFIAMHDELLAPESDKRAFLADERSLIVSRDLARERGWKLGDRLIFESHDHPGQWELTVACIYDAVPGWARRSLWMHYGFFNRGLPSEKRDSFRFVVAQVSEPGDAGRVARELDAHFDAEAVGTLSMEDDVLAAGNLGRISAVLNALDLVSGLILFVVMAIFMNTFSLNVRERTREFGVLRAIGFAPLQVWALVLGEAALLGLAGAGLGLGLSYALLEGLVGPYLQDNLQFQEFEVPPRVALTGFAAGLGLALVAALLPAHRLVALEVRDALGRIT